ncbi:hypothetical protein SISSUDRAFT_28857 [Sistotremastrum suecicum HHB10207 ss-3]|uniref:RING-type domain-containing protein n=1 Tax=Sistotremastrum suecicum HHB10207 ss-3 TaxID=1314776 RepID=A0A166JAG5_9AGAM|nr:hypothetical protein SISSUDRAFT_28857 [Sistotremastrum suecicum HHB10207 ss-3]
MSDRDPPLPPLPNDTNNEEPRLAGTRRARVDDDDHYGTHDPSSDNRERTRQRTNSTHPDERPNIPQEPQQHPQPSQTANPQSSRATLQFHFAPPLSPPPTGGIPVGISIYLDPGVLPEGYQQPPQGTSDQFNLGMGMPPAEKEPDEERAKFIVRAMEPVPVGLLQRLETVGGIMGSHDDSLSGSSGCAVCWDSLLEDKNTDELLGGSPLAPVLALPCRHVFHSSCLIPWFSRHTTCPVCRFDVDPENLTWKPRPQASSRTGNPANPTSDTTPAHNPPGDTDSTTANTPRDASPNMPEFIRNILNMVLPPHFHVHPSSREGSPSAEPSANQPPADEPNTTTPNPASPPFPAFNLPGYTTFQGPSFTFGSRGGATPGSIPVPIPIPVPVPVPVSPTSTSTNNTEQPPQVGTTNNPRPPPMSGAIPFPMFFGAFPMTPPGPPPTRKKWVVPDGTGMTIRERVESKEREMGLRCCDPSCGVGPTDECPKAEDTKTGTVSIWMDQVSANDGEKQVCEHAFHPSCLVTAARVAGFGPNLHEDDSTGEDKMEGVVEVPCLVCRAQGHIKRSVWESGVSSA